MFDLIPVNFPELRIESRRQTEKVYPVSIKNNEGRLSPVLNIL